MENNSNLNIKLYSAHNANPKLNLILYTRVGCKNTYLTFNYIKVIYTFYWKNKIAHHFN